MADEILARSAGSTSVLETEFMEVDQATEIAPLSEMVGVAS
jgi:hypothetical protein